MLRCNKNNRWVIKYFIIIGSIFAMAKGKQIKLLPLSAPDVYRILGETRNLDAVPEGKIVTQGLAAATGFTLGLTNALAGIFLYEVITANITEPAAPVPQYSTQEICFGSRSARSLREAEAVVEAYSHLGENNSVDPTVVRKSGYRRRYRPLRKHSLKNHNGKSYRRRKRPPQRNKIDFNRLLATTNPVTSGAQTTASTGTGGTSGTGTTGTGSEAGTGAGLESTLSTTTSTDNDSPTTCIVIQKPKK